MIFGIWTDMWNGDTMEIFSRQWSLEKSGFTMQTMESEDYEKEVWKVCSKARNINLGGD